MRNLCPECETIHGKGDVCAPTLDEAFETVLHMARELRDQRQAMRAQRFPTERKAIDLVQSYFLLNVKG